MHSIIQKNLTLSVQENESYLTSESSCQELSNAVLTNAIGLGVRKLDGC